MNTYTGGKNSTSLSPKSELLSGRNMQNFLLNYIDFQDPKEDFLRYRYHSIGNSARFSRRLAVPTFGAGLALDTTSVLVCIAELFYHYPTLTATVKSTYHNQKHIPQPKA